MAILLIADVHANYTALEAVLDSAGSVDAVWCLGDTVGYGPQPNECVATVRERAEIVLVGNHDLGCLGTISLIQFNREARIANEWNGQQLDDEHRTFLLDLEPMVRVSDAVTLAHGSPRDPVWEYVLDAEIAQRVFEHFDTQLCFVGHTHQPAIYQLKGQRCARIVPSDGLVLELDPDVRYVINPGGVGQPRDGDARAAWALYDPAAATVTFRRTAYNIRRTQSLMIDAGLPELLAARLSFGL